jgi:hypothetical protein
MSIDRSRRQQDPGDHGLKVLEQLEAAKTLQSLQEDGAGLGAQDKPDESEKRPAEEGKSKRERFKDIYDGYI